MKGKSSSLFPEYVGKCLSAEGIVKFDIDNSAYN